MKWYIFFVVVFVPVDRRSKFFKRFKKALKKALKGLLDSFVIIYYDGGEIFMVKFKFKLLFFLTFVIGTVGILHSVPASAAILAQIPEQVKEKALPKGFETPTNRLEATLNHNSYLYDKNGKRIKGAKKLLKDSTVTIKGQVKKLNAQNKKYFFIRIYWGDDWEYYQIYWAPYKIIHGKAFYPTVQGGYIRVANIKAIEGNELCATSGLATAKRNTYFYDRHAHRTNKKIKKGKKVKVTEYVNLTPNNPDPPYFLKVSENRYLLSSAMVKPRIDVILWGRRDTYVKLIHDTYIYNKDGNIRTPNEPIKLGQIPNSWEVDGLRYLWLPKDKKAELFYHIVKSDPWVETRDGYIKASDVKYYFGEKLKPENTASSVEK